MQRLRPLLFSAMLTQGACGLFTSEEPVELRPGEVEVVLVDRQDGILSEYCLDIAGGNRNVDPANGLQAHTCYSYQGSLGTDQIFDANSFSKNTLALTRYDVCATLSALTAGAKVELKACDGSELQQLTFSGTGPINPKGAPQMCLTAGSDTRMGKGSQHQIKALTLEPCTAEASPRQQWRTRVDKEG